MMAWLSNSILCSMQPTYINIAEVITFDEYGMPQMPTNHSLLETEAFVNKLINYKAVYDAYLQAGCVDADAKEEIKEYLEVLASCQNNYKALEEELVSVNIRLHSAESQQEFKILRDKEVKGLSDRLHNYYTKSQELGSKLAKAEEMLKPAEANRKKLFILQLCLGAAVGGILGIYAHKAAQLIAYEMDNLEEKDIEEQRNILMKLLTNDMFKPLLILSACLGAYGSTLITV